MNQSSSDPRFGSLPQRDMFAQHQQMSIHALQNALPTDRFVYRPEPDIDAGVDGSIELIVDDQYTNLKSHVQLKSITPGSINQDGSVSLSVKVSNMHYLLNGSSPLYVAFVVPLKELRYLWAYDVRQTLEAEKPRWSDQKTITLRFKEILTPSATDQIYERILREGRFQRDVSETLAKALPDTKVVIGISSETLQFDDPDELKNQLENGGTWLVACGYAKDVIEKLNLLDPSVSRLAYFQLLRAYAERVRLLIMQPWLLGGQQP